MKNEKLINHLELLKQIQQVDAPAFLMTRIQERIVKSKSNKFSPQLTWVLSIFLLAVIAFDASLVARARFNAKDNNLIQEMNLMPENSLYK